MVKKIGGVYDATIIRERIIYTQGFTCRWEEGSGSKTAVLPVCKIKWLELHR